MFMGLSTGLIQRSTCETTEVLLKVLGAEVVRVDREMIDEEFWRWVSEEAVRNGGDQS